MNTLVENLKSSGQDYEFYPTTPEMLDVIIQRIFKKTEIYKYWDSWDRKSYSGLCSIFDEILKRDRSVYILDIGAGAGAFKKAFDRHTDGITEPNWRCFHSHYFYAIEKSQILLEKLMETGYSIIGTDFDECTLVDKNADIVFCNPPYSVYENWTCRIISEIQADYIFLIIPERWKQDSKIEKVLKETRAEVETLWAGDFLDAERAARAKVEILLIKRSLHRDELFDRWFEETFQPAKEVKPETDTEKEKRLGNEMIQAESQIDYLVNSYNGELGRLIQNYRAICSLDSALLQEIGLKKETIKKSFLEKIDSLKKVYWNTVFSKLAPVTDRLTHETRVKMRDRFVAKQSVDFTAGNVYALLIWVCRNASLYYDEQITDFYFKLSSDENVSPYKSNQRVFQREEHRWNRYGHRNEKSDPFILDYRIVTYQKVFRSGSYSGLTIKDEADVHDLLAIARTMGFQIGDFTEVIGYGAKGLIYDKSGNVFCEYRIYKNGNTHLKLNRDFVTAMNVYIGRKLGWLKDKADIRKEFPDEAVAVAEQYFNYTPAISVNSMKLLK